MALLIAVVSDGIGRNDSTASIIHEIASIFAKPLLLQQQLLPRLILPQWFHHTSPNQSLTMHLPLHYSFKTCNGYENYS